MARIENAIWISDTITIDVVTFQSGQQFVEVIIEDDMNNILSIVLSSKEQASILKDALNDAELLFK